MRFTVLLLALLIPAAAPAADKPGTLTVNGEATIKLVPDQAIVPVSIISEKETLSATREEGDRLLGRLRQTASGFGISGDDMQTGYNSVQPKYDYGQGVVTQTDVYNGNVGFNFDVTGLSQDKIDALVESLQKAGLTSISMGHQQGRIAARVSGSFMAHDQDAKAMREALKKKMAEVTDIASAAGITSDRIMSNTYENAGKETHTAPARQRISGYRSTVSVNLTVRDKSKVLPLVDALTKAGIDTIGNITFVPGEDGLKKARADLLVKAAKDADEKARALAAAEGVTLDRVISVSEGGEGMPMPYGAPPVLEAAAMKSPDVELPAGQMEIRQGVSVTYALK